MVFYNRLFLFQWHFRLKKLFEHFSHKKDVKIKIQGRNILMLKDLNYNKITK